MSKLIVHLRTYKAKAGLSRVAYDENGNVQNENQIVKLPYNSLEWSLFMKHNKGLNLIKMEVEKVVDISDKEVSQSKIDEIKKAVHDAFYGVDVEVEFTPDQKKIKELEEKMAALLDERSEKKKSGRKPKSEIANN